jgi:flagellar biosynthetic protein FliO
MEIMEQLAAVAAVLAVLVASAWWLRRRGLAAPILPGRGTRGRRLESVERLPLGPQQTLHLIRVGERALLVASYPSGCVLLESTAWREVETSREVAL